jgi:anaerobic magnesium-protoporphyrin IX monomethyl ester cyclase
MVVSCAMKIALIAPPYPLEEAPSPPLGLCYVGAACERAGAQTIILDYIVSRYTPEKLSAALDRFKPDGVGATSVTMNFYEAIRTIRDVKAHNPAIVTMMGGPHVSFDAANTLKLYPELDLIVIGEAERTLLELIPAIHNRAAWPSIRGIAFRTDNQVTTTPPRPLIADLDALPLPARHLLPMSRYQALGFPVSIITSRGCPNQCIFCLGRRMVGQKARFRDARSVVDEIEHILAYGFTRINIADDLFTASRRRVEALCKEIGDRGIRFDWSAFARVNTVDPEMLKAMRAAGCDSISFGIESADPDVLQTVRKGITLDQARRAVAWSKAAGLRAHASFMVGLPGESLESLEATRRFAEELDIEHGYHFLSPFPGTTVREEIQNYDLEILTDDWRKYDANQAIVRTSRLTPQQMDAFVAGIYSKHYERTDDIKKRYHQGSCTEEEFFMIEGYYRMTLIYKLLAGDIIAEEQVLPASDDPAVTLITRVAQATGMDNALIDRTLKSLIAVGYLKYEQVRNGIQWFWTYNKQWARSPFGS